MLYQRHDMPTLPELTKLDLSLQTGSPLQAEVQLGELRECRHVVLQPTPEQAVSCKAKLLRLSGMRNLSKVL